MGVDFNKTDLKLVEAIADRFIDVCLKMGVTVHGGAKIQHVLDLCAANGVNGNEPIDLNALLATDDFTLVHDLGGIARHMNRETGAIENCFMPRCLAHSVAST